MNEIKHVYQLIKDNGQQGDYAVQIKFGELVPVSAEKNTYTQDHKMHVTDIFSSF
jgi:hypothetical protein